MKAHTVWLYAAKAVIVVAGAVLALTGHLTPELATILGSSVVALGVKNAAESMGTAKGNES